MDSLDFNLHTLILKDLAANISQADDPTVLDAGLNLLGSRVKSEHLKK
ncbi:SubName: Full=Related to phosphatidylinositol-4-kinase {ECO:0000313/EMBL:CCA68456.1} [Serendipita indica DSM 11827]|nr:SubName: Full=Related to phosphatidylinositol-4-kinase {ECO:0000313/EMBL:CCA68456.1} [Serendipita indica DSM 11827]